MSAPTITGLLNPGPLELQGDHYCVTPGVLVVQGTTGANPEEEGIQLGVTASIVKPGTPVQDIPANKYEWGSMDESGSRNFTATWLDYQITGGGQTLKVKQTDDPLLEASVTLNVH